MFETLGITLAEFEHFLLVLMRIGALTATLPIFSSASLNVRLKVLLGVFLSFITVSIVPVPSQLPVTFPFLMFYAAKEVVIGLIIGLTANFFFEGLNLAGFLVGRMMSLSMMTLINPSNSENQQVISQLNYFFAILILFAINGHHFFVQSIFDSFYLVPSMGANFQPTLMKQIIQISGSLFLVGLKIGAPIFAVLFLERVLLGLFAKVTPEIQILIVAMPLAILIGYYFLTIYWPYFSYVFLKMWETYKVDITTLIKLLYH